MQPIKSVKTFTVRDQGLALGDQCLATSKQSFTATSISEHLIDLTSKLFIIIISVRVQQVETPTRTMGQARALGRRVRTTSLATLQTYESSVLEATKEGHC